MERRTFLQSVAGGLLLWWRHPWPATAPSPIITDLGDGDYYIEVGCLRCALVRCQDGSSVLGIDIYAAYPADFALPGSVAERRMVPSETLTNKLAEVGFPTVDGKSQLHPSLGTILTYCPTPDEVGKKLQQILRVCRDSRLLHRDIPWDEVAEPWHPRPTATTPKPIITDLEDGDCLVEVGPLQCFLCPDLVGSVLDFHVWLIDHPVPGMTRERLMLCSDTLKRKLEKELGCPCVFEGHPEYPSLVARPARIFTPNEVAEKLQQILQGADWNLLYYDPRPEQSEAELLKFLATQT